MEASAWIARWAHLLGAGAEVLDVASGSGRHARGHRPLFYHLVDALAPGGILLYKTFAAGNQTVGKPSNPAFLLEAGEFAGGGARQAARDRFRRRLRRSARPAYVQRICAVREPQAANSSDERIGKTLTIGNMTSGWPRYVLTG